MTEPRVLHSSQETWKSQKEYEICSFLRAPTFLVVSVRVGNIYTEHGTIRVLLNHTVYGSRVYVTLFPGTLG